MADPCPQELQLTADLIEYARAVALAEARKHCPRHVSYDDVIQDALLHLLSRPPKFDPSRGASAKTLVYTIVQRAVIKYVAREVRHAGRFKAFEEPTAASDRTGEGEDAPTPPAHRIAERRTADLRRSRWTSDDVLAFIDNEDSRALCRLVIACGGNLSAAARRLNVSEGTVRYRLRLLAPKLLAAGFDPFDQGDNL